MVDKRLNMTMFGNTDISDPDIIDQKPNRRRRSPIIVTIDDPKITPVDLQKMMEIGMNAIRFKASNCTKGDKIRLLGKVDKAAAFLCKKYAYLDWPVATCVELKTSIVKSGILEGEVDFITVNDGSEVTLTSNVAEYDKCNSQRIFIDNAYMSHEFKVGTEISIDHDEIVLRCKSINDDNSITCTVLKPGKLTSMCIVCARGAKRATPVLSRKDLQIVKFALEYQVDMIIINYVRKVETIRKIKKYIGFKVKRPIIMSGICTAEGLQNIDEIIQESDGILFSREFLAYELEASALKRMMQIQKWAGAKCQQAGKPFYISGGVFRKALDTGNLMDNEYSDVANALLDGATGFVLVNCPNVDYVLEVIQAITDLCCTVEPFTNDKIDFWRMIKEIKMPVNAAEASALSCATVANLCNARVVVIPTVSGRTAKILMWLRPSCLVLTVSTKTGSTRLLQTYRCVVPLLYKGSGRSRTWHSAMESRVHYAVEYAVKRGWIIYGDTYVTLQRGAEDSAFCDCVRIWTVSISKKSKVECEDDNDLDTPVDF